MLLRKLQREIPFELAVVHINHNLRGEEAEKDAAFVENLCREKGIFCRVYSLPVAERAAGLGVGLEEAGRIEGEGSLHPFWKNGEEIRLPWLITEMMWQKPCSIILPGAQGWQDCAAWLLSGEIISVLCLLWARAEIEAYLREEGQDWREDQSNASLDFSRNVIRHQVLPPLCSRINQRAVEHMAQASELLGEAEAYLRGQEEKLFERLARWRGTDLGIGSASWRAGIYAGAGDGACPGEIYGGQKRYRPRAFKKSLRTAGRGNGEKNFRFRGRSELSAGMKKW